MTFFEFFMSQCNSERWTNKANLSTVSAFSHIFKQLLPLLFSFTATFVLHFFFLPYFLCYNFAVTIFLLLLLLNVNCLFLLKHFHSYYDCKPFAATLLLHYYIFDNETPVESMSTSFQLPFNSSGRGVGIKRLG